MKTTRQNITHFLLFFLSIIIISGIISCSGGSNKKGKQAGDTTANNSDKQTSNNDSISQRDKQQAGDTAALNQQSKKTANQNAKQTPQAVSVTVDQNAKTSTQVHKQVTALTSETFDAAIKSGVTMVDFWAVWCKPCKMEGPIIEEINEEMAGRAKVSKLDIDKNKTIADRFNIQYIPSIIIFNNGKIVKQFTGFTEKDVLLGALTKELK